MALKTGQYLRGGSNGGVTDADGRAFANPTGGIADTGGSGGTVTSPGVTALIATSPALTAGIYRVKGFVVVSGTAETAQNNIRIRVNSINKLSIPSITGFVVPIDIPRLTVLVDNQVIDIVTSAAGVVGSIYTAFITTTRVE